jgi:Flp pilus assembly protein TadG
MLTPLIRRSQGDAKPRSKERGFTMALVAVAIVSLISMAALSIDIGTLYEAKAEAQRAADAGALAAARVISTSGMTGDPGNTGNSWQVCAGMGSRASLAAISVAQAQQNYIGGAAAGTVNVGYSAGSAAGANASCVGISNFAVNPVVTVSVQRTKLPVFFARVFSLLPNGNYTGVSVSATASAEAFNSSDSSPMTPVQPRCVKPWMVPNLDPGNGGTKPFVDRTTGAIQHQGVYPAGVIGEMFNLTADCNANPRRRCTLKNPAPVATAPSTLQYVPGEPPITSVAIAASGVSGCTQVLHAEYWDAVAGCDQTTTYACGQPLANNVDLTADNPGPNGNDSVNAAQCLINATDPTKSNPMTNGQDYLDPGNPPYTYPFQIKAGTNSALLSSGIASSSQISSSPSIVSLPIYDNTTPLNGVGITPVTVVGFLQVFINSVDSSGTGNINVTVMNISGCGNSAANPPVYGTSSVPVRLITQP